MENATRTRVLDARFAVETAEDVTKVLALCEEFLGGWNAHQLATLPERCLPPANLADARSVSEYAFVLAQAHCDVERASPELHAMAAFFTSAAARIAVLTRVAPEDRVPVFIRGLL